MRPFVDGLRRRALPVVSIAALCGLAGAAPPSPPAPGGDGPPGLDTLVHREVLRGSVYREGPDGPVEVSEDHTWIVTVVGDAEGGRALVYRPGAGPAGEGPGRPLQIDPLYRNRPGFISAPPRPPEVGMEWPHHEVVSGVWRGRDHRVERTGTLRVVGDTLMNGVRRLLVDARFELRLHAGGTHGDDPRASTATSLTGWERGRWVITPGGLVLGGERTGELRGVAAELSMRAPREFALRRAWRSVVSLETGNR